ncbi:ATP-binding protein [Euryhalocaulis caribicus]|uniref:ATP-binding protein n=1 Tax=Euryhalocaulis caribicus TaxID=1161401 RepID=UPI0003A91841|nr:ATP-binding protein [Euryhalocaulis caribicus]
MASKQIEAEELARGIRTSAKSGTPIQTQLATSQRIIARVTDGIYREPWAAFRELIANAYDADAKNVVVETGAPQFEKVVVRDDGNGMTPETLAYVIKNIGGSSKRTVEGVDLHTAKSGNPDQSPGGRQLIGKIGIGLFAVAQLTQHFQIITKAKGDRFRSSATVLLETHNEDVLANKDPDEEFVAGIVKIISEEVPEDEIDTHGTSVTLYHLRPEVRRVMQSVRLWDASQAAGVDGDTVAEAPTYHIGLLPGVLDDGSRALKEHLPWDDSESPTCKFEKFVEAAGDTAAHARKAATLEHFDEYLRMLWKLSLSLPLDYVDGHPFDLTGSSGLIFLNIPKNKGQAEQLKIGYDETLRHRLRLSAGKKSTVGVFDVIVDGVQLRRPIHLQTHLRKKSRVGAPVMMVTSEKAPFGKNNLKLAGGELEFEAYLYWNSQIVPKDTVGALVRIREASGTLFDASFMNYQVSEQTRLRQITAEIFVKKGLDSAINIDRESFNYSHPHYLYIQQWLHKALRLLVNRLKAIAKEDLEREKETRQQENRAARESKAIAIWGRRYGVEADPPIPSGGAPDGSSGEIAGLAIDWSAAQDSYDRDVATAVAIVLEAYGLLSSLNAKDRARLISDLLKIFE